MGPPISIRGCVRPSDGTLVRRFVGNLFFQMAEIENLANTVCFFSTGTKENGISQPPDMLNISAIAHSKGLSMAFMLYFQPKLQKDFFKVIYYFFSTIVKFDFEGCQIHCH